MRILHLTATYPPSVNGVAYSVKLLADTQRHLGHQVLIYAPRHSRASQKDPHVVRFPAFPSPTSANYPIGSPLLTPSAIKTFQPHIIHAHHPFHFGYFALHLARYFKARIFLTHHTQYQIYVKTYFKQAAPPVNWLVNQHLLHLYRSLDGIICPTSALSTLLLEQGVSQAVYIPNGIDLKKFKPTIHPISPLCLIYIGRLAHEKSPEKLITLMEHLLPILPDTQLTIIGGGLLLSSLKKTVSKHHLEDQVTFTGPLPRHQLPTFLNHHQLFISYSASEVMPLSYIEALACGLPVCVTKPGKLPDLLNPQNSLTLNADFSVAARQLTQLMKNPQKLATLSIGSALSAQRFSIKTTAHQIMVLYHNSSS